MMNRCNMHHARPPGIVVACFVILPPDIKLLTYLLTYFSVFQQWCVVTSS